MVDRTKIQKIFEEALGSRNVYFQPPESVKMKYPAIVYVLDDMEHVHADNGVYSFRKRYSVTVIDYDPDSVIVDKVASMATCRFDRFYTSENLNHWVFSLYY